MLKAFCLSFRSVSLATQNGSFIPRQWLHVAAKDQKVTVDVMYTSVNPKTYQLSRWMINCKMNFGGNNLLSWKEDQGEVFVFASAVKSLLFWNNTWQRLFFLNIFVQDCSHRTENDHVTSPGGLSKQDTQRLTPSFGFATLWIPFLSSMAYAKKKKNDVLRIL